jgi:hypothetical protein
MVDYHFKEELNKVRQRVEDLFEFEGNTAILRQI